MRAGAGEECVSGGVEAFVADLEAAEEDEPGERGFDDPSVALGPRRRAWVSSWRPPGSPLCKTNRIASIAPDHTPGADETERMHRPRRPQRLDTLP
jgi:hypothetical protein